MALRWAGSGRSGSYSVCAQMQTEGRGKGGRTWYSEPGSLSFTLLAFPRRTEDLQILTLACAREVSEAVKEMTGLAARVKWPNDVVIEDLKIAGILFETRWKGREATLAIGIGINCNQTVFPEEIRDSASSLFLLTSAEVDIKQLFQSAAQRIYHVLERFDLGDDLSVELACSCATLGRRVAITTHHGLVEGTAVSLDPHGSLVVETAEGKREIVQEGDLHYKI